MKNVFKFLKSYPRGSTYEEAMPCELVYLSSCKSDLTKYKTETEV